MEGKIKFRIIFISVAIKMLVTVLMPHSFLAIYKAHRVFTVIK